MESSHADHLHGADQTLPDVQPKTSTETADLQAEGQPDQAIAATQSEKPVADIPPAQGALPAQEHEAAETEQQREDAPADHEMPNADAQAAQEQEDVREEQQRPIGTSLEVDVRADGSVTSRIHSSINSLFLEFRCGLHVGRNPLVHPHADSL